MKATPRLPLGLSPGRAALISSLLCLPFLFLLVTTALDIEPAIPFEHLLIEDGFRPTLLGRAVMLAMLVSLPVAFAINLLPMLAAPGATRPPPFRPTLAHACIGLTLLVLVLMAALKMALRELQPFVAPLGGMAPLGQLGFLLGLLALPVVVLFNGLPHIVAPGTMRGLFAQPTSLNLIVGAVILLVVLIAVSAFALEAVACSIGVPNCD